MSSLQQLLNIFVAPFQQSIINLHFEVRPGCEYYTAVTRVVSALFWSALRTNRQTLACGA